MINFSKSRCSFIFIIISILVLGIPYLSGVTLNNYNLKQSNSKIETTYALSKKKHDDRLYYNVSNIINDISHSKISNIRNDISSIYNNIMLKVKEYISSASSFWEYLNNLSTYLTFLATASVGWIGYRIQKRSNFQSEFDTLFSEHEKVLKEVFFNDNTREFNARTKQILYKLTIKYINGNDCSYPNRYRNYVREIFDKDYETKSYFILLYRLLKAINERGEGNKKDYTSIVRACIPPEILFLISLNAFSGDYDVYKEYRIYISKAYFLEHLPFDYSFFYRIYRMYCTVNRNTKKLFKSDDKDFHTFMEMMLERFYEEDPIKNKIRLFYRGFSTIFRDNIYINKFLGNKESCYKKISRCFIMIFYLLYFNYFIFIILLLVEYPFIKNYSKLLFYFIVNIITLIIIFWIILGKIYYACSKCRYNNENIKIKNIQRCII